MLGGSPKREETFYLREISEKPRNLLRERSDYGQRCPCLSKVSEELFKN
jgi:hypothetical protein